MMMNSAIVTLAASRRTGTSKLLAKRDVLKPTSAQILETLDVLNAVVPTMKCMMNAQFRLSHAQTGQTGNLFAA